MFRNDGNNKRLRHKKINARQWKHYQVVNYNQRFRHELTNQLIALKSKRRGVSNNDKRIYKGEFFNISQFPNEAHDVSDKIRR